MNFDARKFGGYMEYGSGDAVIVIGEGSDFNITWVPTPIAGHVVVAAEEHHSECAMRMISPQLRARNGS